MSAIVISYLVYLLIVGAFAVAGVYHARKFHFPGDKTLVGAGFYLIVVATIVIITFITLSQNAPSGGS